MKVSPLLGVVLSLIACGPEPDGSADISGDVRFASGQPMANTTVAISCPRVALATTVTTNSQGRYNAALLAPSGRIRLACAFGVPDLVSPLVRVDTLIGFAEGLHAQQFINLTAP